MSACPHTDNADKCTCGPGCGCDGTDCPTEAGQPNAAILKLAFWEAVNRCEDKFSYVGSESNGDDGLIDSYIPAELWEHMAVAIAELRAAAGLGEQ